MVKNFLVKTIGYQINLDPYLCLLTIADPELTSSLKYTLTHIIAAARLLYSQLWKSLQIHVEIMLIQKIRDYIEMDRITSILNLKSDENFITK